MKEDRFIPPEGAFTRTVPIRFSHCDPAGIVYFPHYFDMFNGLIEDWYTEQRAGLGNLHRTIGGVSA
jgi:acyl-CoA thioesterase FadM